MEHSWTFTCYAAKDHAWLPLAEWQGQRMQGGISLLKLAELELVDLCHFSLLFNTPVLLIMTKKPTFGFVVVIQERLSYSITRHHSHFSWDTNLDIMVFWEISNKISQTCIPVFLWFFLWYCDLWDIFLGRPECGTLMTILLSLNFCTRYFTQLFDILRALPISR